MNRKAGIPLALAVALPILVLDQLTKYLARIFLSPRSSFPVIDGIFHLSYVQNTGAAFGLLKGATFFFVATSAVCIAVLILGLSRSRFLKAVFPFDGADRAVQWSLGLILGGACGNLIDRIRFSYVVDFLDFRVWPVFNLADSAITIGGFLLFIRILRAESQEKEKKMRQADRVKRGGGS